MGVPRACPHMHIWYMARTARQQTFSAESQSLHTHKGVDVLG